MKKIKNQSQHLLRHITSQIFHKGADLETFLDNIPSTTYDAITDPAVNAAVTTAKVDTFAWTVITLTTTGNAQTLQNPTITIAGKTFEVINNNTSTNSITVNWIILTPWELQWFVWDWDVWLASASWLDAKDIINTPSGDITATNVQDAIDELDSEKQAIVESVTQSSHWFIVWNTIRNNWTANQYTKAQADSAANAEVVGMVTEVVDTSTFKLLSTKWQKITLTIWEWDAVTWLTWWLVIWDVYFLDPDTAWLLTPTATITIWEINKTVIIAISPTKAMFMNYLWTDAGGWSWGWINWGDSIDRWTSTSDWLTFTNADWTNVSAISIDASAGNRVIELDLDNTSAWVMDWIYINLAANSAASGHNGISLDISPNSWTGNNPTGISLFNRNTETDIANWYGLWLKILQVGTGATTNAIYVQGNNNQLATTNWLVNFTLKNTQSWASVMQKIDLWTSAQGHTWALINAFGASTSQRWVRIDGDTTGTGAAIECTGFAATSTNFHRYIILWALTIWISDWTTAEGNLTWVEWDICLNWWTWAWQAAYCDADGTNWTDM